MKALQHRDNPEVWGRLMDYGEIESEIISSDMPTLFSDKATIHQFVVNFGFDAVKDFVLVPVKVERV